MLSRNDLKKTIQDDHKMLKIDSKEMNEEINYTRIRINEDEEVNNTFIFSI